MATKRIPQAKTIRAVIEHLESMGLSVYGQNVDLNDGEELAGCMDYSADDVLKFRKLYQRDAFWHDQDR